MALAVIFLAGVAGCTGSRTPHSPGDSANGGGVAVRLQPTTNVAPAFRELGVRAGFRLPAGWSLDLFGVLQSGVYLTFAASQNDLKNTYIWIVNSRSGRGYRYPPIDQNWYAGAAVGAAGWVVRREVQQLPDDRCHPNRGDDCFQWRLFAQRIGRGAPRLLAQSNSPGSQANAPILATDDRTVVWEQSSDGKLYGIYQWTPGAAHAQRRLVRTTPGEPEFDGRRLYDVELTSRLLSETPTQRVLELSQHGAALKARTLGTFVGQSHSQIRAGTILHFPANGAARGRWHQATLATSTDNPVGTQIEGPYAAVWITDDQFVSWSADGWYLMTTTRPNDSIRLGGPDSGFAVPRTDGQHLTLGMNGYYGTAIVGSTALR